MRTSAKFRIYREARAALAAAYPSAFPARGRRPPLKVGILREMVEDGSHGLPARRLRLFLSVWTRSTAYLEGVARARSRKGLDGAPAGPVDPRHAAEAAAAVARRKAAKRSRAV